MIVGPHHTPNAAIKKLMFSINVSDLTEEMPAIMRVSMTFSLLKSTDSPDYTQTARQATYYAFSPARNNAFAEQNNDTVNPFSHSRNIFSRKTVPVMHSLQIRSLYYSGLNST